MARDAELAPEKECSRRVADLIDLSVFAHTYRVFVAGQKIVGNNFGPSVASPHGSNLAEIHFA
jgi:hypothetical protein